MSDDFITRNEFSEHKKENDVALERIHERVDEIRESQIKMEASSLRIESFGNKIFEVMYGKDEHGGLISAFHGWTAHTKIHWAIIFLILTTLVGLFFVK